MSRPSLVLLGAALLTAIPGSLVAQDVPAQAGAVGLRDTLPLDPNVKFGKLPNGLTYYIERHPEPAKRAELWLAVNAGAIQEDDDQQGMAHLIEHMGFNGTTHFRKNELIDYLRSVGVRFGPDVNAGTNYDETVYMLHIPTDTARILEQGIVVLSDWAGGSLFDSAEVAKERGVVVEEWRGGQGAGFRMRTKTAPIIYRGSKYAERNVIGSEQSIMSATVPLLKRFYNDWYRPDLEAVIVVGDVDVPAVESLITKYFGGYTPRQNPRSRANADVPDNREPLVAIAADAEATYTSVSLAFKLAKTTVVTAGDYRRRLVEGLFSSILNARLSEIARRADAPFLGAFAFKGGFTRSKDAFAMAAQVKDGASEGALEALVTEARRVEQFGVLQSELDRAKANTLRGLEQSYAERDKRPSGAIVGSYVGHFLAGQPVPGPEYTWRLGQQLIPGVTLAEVNALVKEWITPDNRVITVQSPEKPGVKVPTQVGLLAAIDRGLTASVVAYSENVSTEPLVANLRPAGRIVSSTMRAGVGIAEWKLSNGARVLVKPTDFRADQVVFGAYGFGGTSVLPDSEMLHAQFASSVVNVSGVGAFNRTDLGKRLAGKAAGVAPNVSGLTQGLNGNASPKDIETMLQLTYLYFTAPRLDTAAVRAMMNQNRAALANRSASPEATYFDTISVTMGSYHPRDSLMTLDRLARVNPERALQIYRTRLADAGAFTFIFVGNVDTIALKPLVERYLASLPATGRKEMWKDVGIRAPTGVVEKVVRKGTEPKSISQVIFTGPFQYAQANTFAIHALVEIMQYKLIETLREQMSGTYSPGIGGYGVKMPRPQYRITISYGSSPENVDKLWQAALAIIDTLKRQGPTQADVDKVREQMIRTREESMKQNGFWMANIVSREQYEEDLAASLASYDAMVRALTPAQVQQAANAYLNMKNYARFVLLPEAPKPTP